MHGGVLGVRGEPGRGECGRLVVGAGLGRDDRPVGDRVAAAVAAVPVLREADDRGRAAGRVPGHHFVRGGDQRGRGAAERVRERAVRARRPPDRDAAGHAGLPGLRGPGQRRLDEKLQAAAFDDAMQAALADEPVLGADETPVNVLTRDTDPETGEPEEGAPHVLIVRPPGGKLTWLRAMGSRRAAAITAILSFFTGILITDGYTAYQQMLTDLEGIQQCAAHVIRRCRAVSKLGPGSLQSWATDVIIILRQAHLACEDARSRGQPPRPAGHRGPARPLRRGRLLRDHAQPAPGLARRQPPRLRARLLAARLRPQVWLFTSDSAVEWTNNVSEQGAKAAKRHQAVSGYWHTQATLARWCRIRSYLDSATAHGLTALEYRQCRPPANPGSRRSPPATCLQHETHR